MRVALLVLLGWVLLSIPVSILTGNVLGGRVRRHHRPSRVQDPAQVA